MSIINLQPATDGTSSAPNQQISASTAKYLQQIAALNTQIRDLERKLLQSQVTEDVGYKMAERANQHTASIEERNQWLEQRNAELENPKGGHYASLSWPGKIISCIKKLRRPLRFQEIMQELNIMDRLHKTESWLTEKTISVTLSSMAKDGRLHSEKVRGTRGNFYALNDWLEEDGKLNEKMRRKMW